MEIRIGHAVVFGSLELVCIDFTRWFVVDREREELRSLDLPCEKMELAQRQCGRGPEGDLEVLERYATEDGSISIVLDASPAYLADLKDSSEMVTFVSVRN